MARTHTRTAQAGSHTHARTCIQTHTQTHTQADKTQSHRLPYRAWIKTSIGSNHVSMWLLLSTCLLLLCVCVYVQDVYVCVWLVRVVRVVVCVDLWQWNCSADQRLWWEPTQNSHRKYKERGVDKNTHIHMHLLIGLHLTHIRIHTLTIYREDELLSNWRIA